MRVGIRPSSASSIDQRRNPRIGDENPELEERYPGLDRVTVSLSVGVPLPEAIEQLEWFARDVMPAFKGSKVAVPAMAN
jgi:hypothetical protein